MDRAYKKKLIVVIAGIVLGACVVLLGNITPLFEGIDAQAVMALAVLVMCICWWVGSVLPEAVTALVMLALFVVLCNVPTTVAFSAFSGSTWWLLVAAFSLGYGMQKSGLMVRMTNAILRVFPRTFTMQSAGLIVAGTLVGPLIPSLSAKATMLAPLSMSISDSLGYERKGKEASGLFLAMFTGIRNVGPAVISASIIGYGLVATLPTDVAQQFDMLHWFVAMIPWFLFVTIANYVAIVVLYAPKGERARLRASKAAGAGAGEGEAGVAAGAGAAADAGEAAGASASASKGSARGRSSEKTPMSSAEKRLAVIMVCCITLWVAEPICGIESHIVALAAMLAMVILKVVDLKDLMKGISWSSLIFIGCVLGLADVFAELGIDVWIVSSFQGVFETLASNTYLLIIGICLITIALRFIIVSEMAYVNIFMAFMVPLALTLGVSPWMIGVCVYAVVNPWFTAYQNPIYLTAFYATEGEMVKQSAMAKYCALYLVICICGLLISVPYWQLLGIA